MFSKHMLAIISENDASKKLRSKTENSGYVAE